MDFLRRRRRMMNEDEFAELWDAGFSVEDGDVITDKVMELNHKYNLAL